MLCLAAPIPNVTSAFGLAQEQHCNYITEWKNLEHTKLLFDVSEKFVKNVKLKVTSR